MINKIIFVGTTSVVILASLASCSSTKSTANSNTKDKVIYKSTSDFKPKMTYRFDKFDTSVDGQVNFSEWKKGMNRMLEEYDNDGNGSFEKKKGEIIYFEWMITANKNEDDTISPLEVDKGLKAMFKKASGKNSLISKREFKTFNWSTGESFAKRKTK